MANETAKTHKKEPLLRITKRAEQGSGKAMLLKFISIIVAIVAGGLFMLILGFNPFEMYKTIVVGALQNEKAIQLTIRFMIPLLICSLGVSLAFKMRFWNIGGEGQIILGGIFASYFALFHADWPRFVLIPVMFVAGMIGGALWGLVPAFFKAKFNTNETLLTLMLNYVALNIIVFLRDGPWSDPESKGFPKIARFDKNAQLGKVFGIHIGWIVALVLVVLVFIYLRYTKQGYEISVVGASQPTAKYAGMNVRRIILRTMMLSGAICGIAGMVQATGSDMTLAESVAGGIGFTAIIVAWLSNLNPFGILITSFLFSVLEKGCSMMQSTYGLTSDTSQVLQGIILFCVLGGEFFIRYKIVGRSKQKASPGKPKEAAA